MTLAWHGAMTDEFLEVLKNPKVNQWRIRDNMLFIYGDFMPILLCPGMSLEIKDGTIRESSIPIPNQKAMKQSFLKTF